MVKGEKPNVARKRFRRARFASTDAERCLWDLLRDRGVAGAKFTRDVPFGCAVVDFACREQRLVVVIDGGRHSNPERNRNRDQALLWRGYRVLQFGNDDVLKNPDRVRRAVNAALVETLALPDKKNQ